MTDSEIVAFLLEHSKALRDLRDHAWRNPREFEQRFLIPARFAKYVERGGALDVPVRFLRLLYAAYATMSYDRCKWCGKPNDRKIGATCAMCSFFKYDPVHRKLYRTAQHVRAAYPHLCYWARSVDMSKYLAALPNSDRLDYELQRISGDRFEPGNLRFVPAVTGYFKGRCYQQ